jgi:hypothetical protein
LLSSGWLGPKVGFGNGLVSLNLIINSHRCLHHKIRSFG